MDELHTREVAVFGGGCFWCTEAVFQMFDGVITVTPGYAGGHTEYPTYEQVCAGTTGHAEAIRVEYDPRRISYRDLLAVFFTSHDPTSLNRQGNDVGTQYRSLIATTTQDQYDQATAYIRELNTSHKEGKPIVTDIMSLTKFWPAEKHHQNYYNRNQDVPYCQVVINSKLEKAKKDFARLLKKNS